MARSNRKYFGAKLGVTWYSLTSDQYTGLHGLIIPGTLRDSLYLLATVLEQQTRFRPQQIMTDTHGYSDVVFGLFKLLGLQFSPRLADMDSTRYWRLDREADYGILNEVARHKVSVTRIAQQWARGVASRAPLGPTCYVWPDR